MKKNYYTFINEKIKSLDIDILKKKKEIETLKEERQLLKETIHEKNDDIRSEEEKLNSILQYYKTHGYKTTIAKRNSVINSWNKIKLIIDSKERISIVDAEGHTVGEIVGEKNQKIRLLLKKLPDYTPSITEVDEETFKLLISF